MPVPASISDLSTSPGANSPAGTETPTEGDNYIRTLSAFIAQLRDQLNGTSGSPSVLTLTVTNGLTVGGATALNGNVTIGDAGADALTLNAATVTLANTPTIGGAATWSGIQTFNANPLGRITSGTYTPTVTVVSNVTSASASGVCTYMRIGNVVHVAGEIQVQPSAIGVSSIRISLPIASNFAATSNLAGVGAFVATQIQQAAINAVIATDDALATFGTNLTSSNLMSFSFQYQVI